MSTATSVTADCSPVLKYLHAARLGPYKQRCGGSDYSALALHSWNTHMAAAIHEALSPVEIILRNALDDHLASWNERQAPPANDDDLYTRDWLLRPARPLAQLATDGDRKKLQSYAEKSKRHRANSHPRKNAPIEHNDLLSQTTFGFWNGLLPHKHGFERKRRLALQLWNEGVKDAFPNLKNDPSGYATADRVRRLHALRNRVAHMENLLDVDIDARYRDALNLLTSIDGDLYRWFSGISRIRAVNSLRPHP
ncbi:hypothetical protein WDY80_23920 (plasmid) [Gordonia hongkongensis]|uniref:hypothetical protein n=1 Tax=Gordonia hongkongensis TaxID=1701090 RepID=UPI0030D32C67